MKQKMKRVLTRTASGDVATKNNPAKELVKKTME